MCYLSKKPVFIHTAGRVNSGLLKQSTWLNIYYMHRLLFRVSGLVMKMWQSLLRLMISSRKWNNYEDSSRSGRAFVPFQHLL